MLDVLVQTAAAAMTTAALWHLPAVPHTDLRHRALWGCYAGSAASLWLQVPAVDHLVDLGPTTDCSILVKAYISIGALLALAIYMATGFTDRRGGRPTALSCVTWWTARFAPAAALVTACLMTVVFFSTGVHAGSVHEDFVLARLGRPGTAAFLTPYYLFAGAVNTACWLHWSRMLHRADTAALRTSLALMSTAMLADALYALIRLSWVLSALAEPRPAGPDYPDRLIASFTADLQIALSIAFAVGVLLPPAAEVVSRAVAWRMIRDIYPLWASLTRAVPTVAGLPESLPRALFRASPPVTARLYLMTQEIGDICEQLRHYAPKGLYDAAEDATAGHPDPDAAAEAAWINAALVAVANLDRHNTASQPLPTKPIGDSWAEAKWLCRVKRAFATLTEEDGQVLLRESRQAS